MRYHNNNNICRVFQKVSISTCFKFKLLSVTLQTALLNSLLNILPQIAFNGKWVELPILETSAI